MKRIKDSLQRIFSHNNRGIALLFTLGILALLLVLALAFATSSIVQRKAAANNADLSAARIMAEAVLERVTALMQFYDIGVTCSHCDSTTHPTSPNTGTSDWIHRLETMEGSSYVFDWDSSYTNINWEYISLDGSLIGRTAYVVIPGGGLDPGDLVESGKDENGYPETRIGVDVNEINLASLDPDGTPYLTAPNVHDFTCFADGGKFTGTWTDFQTLFSAANLNITSATVRDKFRKWFVLNTTSDPEAFWLDDPDPSAGGGTEGDGKVDINTSDDSKNELYHRFNIARADWDTLTVANITTAVAATDNYNRADGTYDGGGLQWLAYFGKDSNGTDAAAYLKTFSTIPARRNQIAANLIDYCDSNRAATADATYTYTGNDESPYINEVRLEVEATVNEDTSNPGAGQSTYTCLATIKVVDLELVNIYDTVDDYTFTTKATVTVEGTTEWLLDGVAVDSDPFSYQTGGATDIINTIGDKLYDTTFIIPGTWDIATSTSSTPDTTGKTMTVTVQITKLEVKLIDNGAGAEFYDFSYIETDSGVVPVVNNVTANTTASLYLDWQVDDPRQNLNEGDWGAPDIAGNQTLGTKNSNCNPNGAGDAEPNAEPWTVSTAYIRNAAMQTPWELGCIHRAAKWETLNLKEFNTSDSNFRQGGGDYNGAADADADTDDGGDANILDQVKVGNAVVNNKKISLKTHDDNILYALFHKIKIGSTYAAPGTAGTAVAEASIPTIRDAVKAKSVNFFSRGCLANVSELSDAATGGTKNNDAKKEELIGKVINLTSVNQSDYFTVIVLAQAIKDVGTTSDGDTTHDDGNITVCKDLDQDGTVDSGNCKETTWDIDGNGSPPGENLGLETTVEQITGCELGSYNQYADEIVAEQKIKAEVYRNPTTGKCTVLKYEYVED